jgi:hypothetical protein
VGIVPAVGFGASEASVAGFPTVPGPARAIVTWGGDSKASTECVASLARSSTIRAVRALNCPVRICRREVVRHLESDFAASGTSVVSAKSSTRRRALFRAASPLERVDVEREAVATA